MHKHRPTAPPREVITKPRDFLDRVIVLGRLGAETETRELTQAVNHRLVISVDSGLKNRFLTGACCGSGGHFSAQVFQNHSSIILAPPSPLDSSHSTLSHPDTA